MEYGEEKEKLESTRQSKWPSLYIGVNLEYAEKPNHETTLDSLEKKNLSRLEVV